MLDVALEYATFQWHVFPLSFSKVPLKNSHGLLDATTDPEQLRTMFARRGAVNVAVSCGPSRLLVLDADGPEGLAELRTLAPLPPTLVAQTPRGGLHVFFRLPDGVEIRSNNATRSQKGGGGLDIKGAGGYVVLSPSRTRQGSYQWVTSHAPAVAPQRVLDYCEARGTRPAPVPAQLGLGALPAFLGGDGAKGGTPQRLAAVARAQHWTQHDEARIRSALSAIPADGYDDWLRCGMILRGLDWTRPDGTDLGFDIWNEWSSTCAEKYAQAVCEQKWASFGRVGGNNATLGTLFHLATQYGWNGRVLASGGINGVVAPVVAINGATTNTSQPLLLQNLNSGAAGANGAVGSGGQAAQPIMLGVVFPDTDRNGSPKSTFENTRHAIQALGVVCRKDLFHERMLIGGHIIGQWAGDLSDDAVLVLRTIIRRTYGFDPGVPHTRDAAQSLCLQNPFNPVTEYLAALQWDGQPRIDTWVSHYLGAEDTALHRAFGRLMLIAAVRRARCPGTKFDQIVVLEGPEGTGKSTAFKLLAGEENFSDQHILAQSDREQQEAFQGVWIHEIAELSGIRRTDVVRVKAFASRTEDRARPAWGRFRVDMKRRGIFVGTTNDESYLQSETGNRRFWPLKTGRIDLRALERDRDQLWAEAAWLEAKGAAIELAPALYDAARDAQNERMEQDPWVDNVLHAVELLAKKGTEEPRVMDVLLSDVFLYAVKDVGRVEMNRVARCLQAIGVRKIQKTRRQHVDVAVSAAFQSPRGELGPW